MEASYWQEVRAFCEKTLVIKDWFETFIAQNLVMDTLIADLYYKQLDMWMTENEASDVAMLTDFMTTRYKDSSRWVDSVIKTVCKESSENSEQIKEWIATWRIKAQEALEPLASELLGDAALADAFAQLESRLKKLGIAG